MAIDNIITESWQGHSHGEVEDALKAALQKLAQDIENYTIQPNSVTAAMLSVALRDVIVNAVPNSRTINGKSLAGNITLKTSDIQNDSGYITQEDLPESATPDNAMSGDSENAVQNKVIKAYVDAVSQRIDTLIGSGNVQGAIDTFNEVVAFLNGINSSDTLAAKLLLKANAAEVVKSISVNNVAQAKDEQGNVNINVQAGTQGPKGDTGDTLLVDGNFDPVTDIVNDTTTGGANKAWSAEMGKRLAGREATDRQRIDAIVAILKKSVFTDDETAAFAALDALANGIDSISFNASSHKFTDIGDTFTLLIVTDPAGKTAQVTWATSNASVATVNNGVVTAVADGTATITATTTDGKVAICNIEVETIVITGLSLNKSTLTLNGNDANETLIATTVPAGYESGVQWSSSDPTKATVDNNGKVTAVANGQTTITASIGGQTATCQVTVTGVVAPEYVDFGSDALSKQLVLANYTHADPNEITTAECANVTSLLVNGTSPFAGQAITSANWLQYFTGIHATQATDAEHGFGTEFANCTSLESIIVPEGITRLGKDTMYQNTACVYVDLPSTLETIFVRGVHCDGVLIVRSNNCTLKYGGINGTPTAIYVPDDYVETYKAADRWSDHASIIHPLSDLNNG